MTKLDKFLVMDVFDKLEKQEREYCDRYVALNPQDKKGRERIRDYYLQGLWAARTEVWEALKRIDA